MNPMTNTRLAPNGRPVGENFARWFGHSALVDRDGAPLVLYHGSNQPLDKVDADWFGENTGSYTSRLGFWLTDSPLVAQDYADQASRKMIAGSSDHEAQIARYLALIAAAEKRRDFHAVDQLTEQMEAFEFSPVARESSGQNIVPVYVSAQRLLRIECDAQTGLNWEVEAVSRARDERYDAVLLLHCADCASHTVSTHCVVFDPARVKSVFNSGDFDPDRHSLSDGDDMSAEDHRLLSRPRAA